MRVLCQYMKNITHGTKGHGADMNSSTQDRRPEMGRYGAIGRRSTQGPTARPVQRNQWQQRNCQQRHFVEGLWRCGLVRRVGIALNQRTANLRIGGCQRCVRSRVATGISRRAAVMVQVLWRVG